MDFWVPVVAILGSAVVVGVLVGRRLYGSRGRAREEAQTPDPSMQWLAVYHAPLSEDWHSGRRGLIGLLIWVSLVLLTYWTRRPVEYVWDALPWLALGSVFLYFVNIVSPLFACKKLRENWTGLPRLVREAAFPLCAASYLTSLPAKTWAEPGNANTRSQEIEMARRTLEWAMGEHIAKAWEYERLLRLLAEKQGFTDEEITARLARIWAGEDDNFSLEGFVSRFMDNSRE